MAVAQVDLDAIAEATGANLKTVQRWINGRTPVARFRSKIVQLVGEEETYLWPEILDGDRVRTATESELVALYARRAQEPPSTDEPQNVPQTAPPPGVPPGIPNIPGFQAMPQISVEPQPADDDRDATLDLIRQVERARRSRVLVYWTSPLAKMGDGSMPSIYDQLCAIGDTEQLG